MIPATIRGKSCKTISDFYAMRVPGIAYSCSSKPIRLVRDFYNDFLIDGQRLPAKNVVEAWHKLLLWYVEQPDAIFFVRKYEAGKSDNEWDNRRGAVVRFQDGFEIAYASNFLAHEIFLMAYHGFVPGEADFMTTVKNRELRITSGTNIEKQIRLYPSPNKKLTCYLTHIMDVNGKYLRDDGTYRELSKTEAEWIFPRGTDNDWISSADNIYHVKYCLSDAEKDLVKAHFLRFLDPMNYYLTPLTKHCKHEIPGFGKNIGEYPYLTYYIQQQYHSIFATDYDILLERAKFADRMPKGYTGNERLALEYSTEMREEDTVQEETSETTPEDFLCQLGDFMREHTCLTEGSIGTYISKIEKILQHGIKPDTLCNEIDSIIREYDKASGDHNTRAALKKVRMMNRYPYISYQTGYQSFEFADKHMIGYCIDGDTITISYCSGFRLMGDITRKISEQDMQILLEILEEAKKCDLFAKSNTVHRHSHGALSTYDYSYGGKCGTDCTSLFRGDGMAQCCARYDELIAKLTK